MAKKKKKDDEVPKVEAPVIDQEAKENSPDQVENAQSDYAQHPKFAKFKKIGE